MVKMISINTNGVGVIVKRRWVWGIRAVDATGRSGGLCTIWDSAFFSATESVKDPNFLAIIGTWLHKGIVCGIVNVYAPCMASARESLWQRLENFLVAKQGVTWFIYVGTLTQS